MMKENPILSGLDGSQREAVENVKGPVLIVAGAGSGKTRVLTSRIAYIMQLGAAPERILALTFTKKAASEMKERIGAMVGERSARRLYMGTFHSVFIRFLREFADSLGYPQGFTIYDTGDSVSALKRIIKDRKLDDKTYKPKDVLARISMAKNNLVTPEAYAANMAARENDRHAKKPEIYRIYAAYQQLMQQAGVMDFDDILLNMNILLRDNTDALDSIAGRFDYILVDEYQDTNFSQYLILRKLSERHKNICVVGDDSQSIYAFRGAKIENILNFRKDYQDSKIYRLEQNYRSTKNIVNAANSLIAKNEGRIPKNCYSNGKEGDRIRLIQSYTEQEEGLLIASSIVSKMQEEHAKYQDFAILYRTNSQSRALEEALRKRNLPYMIYSGNSFFDRQEVKDMMAYFKLAVNNSDDEAFRRIVNKPARGIGDTSLDALAAAAQAAKCPLFKAIDLDGLENFGLRPAAIAKIKAFRDMIAVATSRMATDDAYTVATYLSNTSGLYRSFKEDNSIESQSRAANIEELVNGVKSFIEEKQNYMREELMADESFSDATVITDADLPVVTLGDYLEDISLLSAVDMTNDEDNNKIALMTVHSAKGLEFPYVYVAGMEENLFPSGGMFASENDIEEERRLFYVALTRAKVSVDLTFAQTRMRNGKHESNAPSRFIREIDRRYIANPLGDDRFAERTSEPQAFQGFGRHFKGQKYGASSSVSYERKTPAPAVKPVPIPKVSIPRTPVPPRADEADFVPVSILELREGQRIEHSRFGFGKILKISGSATDLKAVIDFDSYGEKILLLKYAKIRLA